MESNNAQVVTRLIKVKIVPNEKEKNKTSEEKAKLVKERYERLKMNLETGRQLKNKYVNNWWVETLAKQQYVNTLRRGSKEYQEQEKLIKKAYSEKGKTEKKLLKNPDDKELMQQLEKHKKDIELLKKEITKMNIAMSKRADEIIEEKLGAKESTRYTAIKDDVDKNIPSTISDYNKTVVLTELNNYKYDIAKGNRSLPNYKDSKMLIFNLNKDNATTTALYRDVDNGKYYMKIANGMTLELLTNSKRQNEKELSSVLEKVLHTYKNVSLTKENKNNYYRMCDSELYFNKKGILTLGMAVSIPESKKYLLSNRTVGVDLGIAIPAVCALNDTEDEREFIGSKDDFLHVRIGLQERKRRLQKSLKLAGGGHGRKTKLKALERLSSKERNFAKTYNHKVSSHIIKFALDNQASTINIEDLSSFGRGGRNSSNSSTAKILRNWSYFELQSFIEYKANKEGIKVNKINPYLTSQTCSKCKHYEKGQRVKQDLFICKQCGYKENADFNAARNIALA